MKEFSRRAKKHLKRLLNRFGYEVTAVERVSTIPISKEIPWDVDSEFAALWSQWSDYTGLPWQAYFTLYEGVRYLVNAGIDGALVECGVQQGVGLIVMGEALQRFEGKNRRIFGYDTFSGMSQPTEFDFMADGVPAEDILAGWPRRDGVPDFCYGPYEDVLKNIRKSKCAIEHISLVKGKVEETIPGTIPDTIALLKLDTDWYESTRHELEHLYPLLNRNGILVVDDYGCWFGARKAVDEYFASGDRPFFVLDAPHGSRVAQKVEQPFEKSGG